jgi:hypothetical protein
MSCIDILESGSTDESTSDNQGQEPDNNDSDGPVDPKKKKVKHCSQELVEAP